MGAIGKCKGGMNSPINTGANSLLQKKREERTNTREQTGK